MSSHTANGQRIYYTGDMANMDGFGTITEQHPGGRWADQITITMDDGREISIPTMAVKSQYSGNCSTRFVTAEAYAEYRTAQLKACGLI
jgi:hypothetical protein